MASGVGGYKNGAPEGACATMTPGHGVPAQSGDSPYSITTSASTLLAGGSLTGNNILQYLLFIISKLIQYHVAN